MERKSNYWTRGAAGRFSRRTVLGAAGAGAAFALVGCGGDDDDDSNSGGDASATTDAGASATSGESSGGGAPTRGGELRQGVTFAAQGIDPHIETSVGLRTSQRVYSPLIGFNYNDNTYHTVLAESLEQPTDTEYVFKLRANAKFQNIAPVNGRAVTAEDVVYSLERFRDHPRATRNGFYKNFVANMEAIDATTFKLTTTTPYAESLGAIGIGDGFGPNSLTVAREDVEAQEDLSNGGVGSGPFMIEEYVKGERTRLVRNPDYFDPEMPLLDAWSDTTITDNNTLLQAFLQGQLDINGASLTKLDFEDLERNGDFVTMRVPTLNNGCLELGAGQPPFNDPRVRQAVKIGMNRGQFIDKIFQGEGTPAGAISSGLSYWALPYDEVEPYVGPDVQKAKELLSAAGYPDGFDLQIITSTAISAYIDYAEIIVAELKNIGINAELQLNDLPTFLSEHMYAGNFSAACWVTNGYPTLVTPLGYYHKNGLGNGNWWHYENEEVSAKIDEQFATLDAEARLPIVQEVQRMVLEDWAPHIPLIDGTTYSAYSKRLQGYDPMLGSYQLVRNSEYFSDGD